MEQNVSRVLHDSGSHRAYLPSDARCALRLGGLVERKKRGDAGVERQMRDDLSQRNFKLAFTGENAIQTSDVDDKPRITPGPEG